MMTQCTRKMPFHVFVPPPPSRCSPSAFRDPAFRVAASSRRRPLHDSSASAGYDDCMAKSESRKSSRRQRKRESLDRFIAESRRIVKANREFQRFMRKATGELPPVLRRRRAA